MPDIAAEKAQDISDIMPRICNALDLMSETREALLILIKEDSNYRPEMADFSTRDQLGLLHGTKIRIGKETFELKSVVGLLEDAELNTIEDFLCSDPGES